MSDLFNVINGTTGCYPGDRFLPAVHALATQCAEPLIGKIQMQHCQLCPQNYGILDDETIETLKTTYPSTRFRLHANVRIPEGNRSNRTAGTMNGEALHYFKALARINQKLHWQPYTLHPGKGENLTQIFENITMLTDIFEVQVGVEGMYANYPINNWIEYQCLLESGCHYALDLSHLNIVYRRHRVFEMNLVNELISSDKCLEIHLSDNDGRNDTHKMLNAKPWWFDTLIHTPKTAILFTEGNQKL